ncbi:hypothetical protein ACWGNZ_23170 (plasmid) [Sphingomonas zeae]
MAEPFDPACADHWIAHGRNPVHAAALAGAWRDFPDLPADAPLTERQARGRERIAAMRPINDAIAAEDAARQETTNFAFTDRQLRDGKGSDREIAILRARDEHGYSWDLANRYADGWYAAHAGWPYRYPAGIPCRASPEEKRAAYDLGFAAGGGDRTDLFDAARRAIVADMRRDNLPPAPTVTPAGRPLPGSWPKPGDAPRPARWSRRLAILSAGDIGGDPAWDFLALLRARSGAGAATVIVLTPAGFVAADDPVRSDAADQVLADRDEAARQLGRLLVSCEFDDILVALQGRDLDLLDAIAHVLPLARTMERTRNSRLQQRTHLCTWLDRGLAEGVTMAQGHIRWGKVIAAFYGSLGEFTARHVGPAPGRGHLVCVETRAGLATGYAAADGTPLTPEIIVSSKAKLRPAMATALRAFAAATPIMAAARAA